MGLLKPSETFAREVQPAYHEFLAEPLSERRANAAARAVDHQLDWTFEYYKRIDVSRLLGDGSHGAFRNALFAQCNALRVMWELSDAAHHRFLEPRKVKRLVARSTDAYEVVEEELWVGDHNVFFLPTLTSAVDFWRSWPD